MKSKYKTLSEWRKAEPNAYDTARRNSMLPKICDMFGWELPKEIKPNGYWTLERCKASALQFYAKTEWYRGDPTAYRKSIKLGYMDECSSHMVQLNKPEGYWTKEMCVEEALKYKTVREWNKNSSGSYSYAGKYGWLDECKKHMGDKHKENGFWLIKENVIKDALKYTNHKEWRLNSGSAEYSARIYGWLGECKKHMDKTQHREKVKHGYWNIKDNVLLEVLKFNNKTEWSIKSSGSLASARKNGWYNECVEIINKNK